MSGQAPLGWPGIVRLGMVQAAIGAIVMLATSLLNRVMVVEYALPAALPAGLVAWHYAVQLTRPLWGHGSDRGRRRTPWIVAGIAVLATGAMIAVGATTLIAARPIAGYACAILGFSLIGAGVGAAGTSLLALLAARTAPQRRAAAAAITWTMMVAGIAVTAGIAGSLLDPFSASRLAAVAAGVASIAFGVAVAAVWGIEGTGGLPAAAAGSAAPERSFGAALRATLADPEARRFTLFVFLSMLAYSMQDLILEPFAGLLFGLTPGQSTQLSGAQHGGVLAGMMLAGIGGSAFRGVPARGWIVGGCVGSGIALGGLALAAQAAPAWPLVINIVALGFANGVFAVAAVGAMMGLAGARGGADAGLRMGVWGAAQALAFGLGGLVGAVAVDLLRLAIGSAREAFLIVFAAEALLFLVAARLAFGTGARSVGRSGVPVTMEEAIA